MFQMTAEEGENLRCQIGISSSSGASINFNKDDEAYLANNDVCPLFMKDDKGTELKLKEATYYYPPMK